MDNRSEHLGNIGESFFKDLCTKAYLTATKPEKDRFGWDFYVEFPKSDYNHRNLLENIPIKCKVQVKATDKQSTYIPIKLTNLVQSAMELLPIFYFIVEYNGKDEVQNAFIVHIDNEMITEILNTIQERGNKSQQNFKLHKSTKNLRYDNSHQMPNLNHNTLRNTLFKHIGKNYSDYIKTKLKHLETIKVNHLTTNLSIISKDSSLAISSIELISVQIQFVDEDSTKKLELPAQLDAPIKIEKEKRTIKIIGDHFNISITPTTQLATITLSEIQDEFTNIYQLRDYLLLRNILFSTKGKTIINVAIGDTDKLKFSILPSDKGLFPFEKSLEITSNVIDVISEFKVSANDSTTLDNISTYALYTERIKQLLYGTYSTSIKVDADWSSMTTADNRTPIAFVQHFATIINGKIFCLIVTFLCYPLKEQVNKSALQFFDVKIEDKFWSSHEAFIIDDLSLKLLKVTRKYQNKSDYITITNVPEFISEI